jgi:hypothetical protein
MRGPEPESRGTTAQRSGSSSTVLGPAETGPDDGLWRSLVSALRSGRVSGVIHIGPARPYAARPGMTRTGFGDLRQPLALSSGLVTGRRYLLDGLQGEDSFLVSQPLFFQPTTSREEGRSQPEKGCANDPPGGAHPPRVAPAFGRQLPSLLPDHWLRGHLGCHRPDTSGGMATA